MSKDLVLLQKENMRILVYDETPDGEFPEMMVNITVDNQDMTLTRYQFHKIHNLMTHVRELEKRDV
jgi:hypothetical protein